MQTLNQALYLARSGESQNLKLAANRLDGIAPGTGGVDQALDDIMGWLPHRSDRAYTRDQFVAATHEVVGSTGRYSSKI
jgi:hypothetical protein